MPHATTSSDANMGETDEAAAIQRYLQGQGPEGGAEGFSERDIDQTDKADDAIDYEDLDDDDLPEEEVAAHGGLEESQDGGEAMGGFDGLEGFGGDEANGKVETNGFAEGDHQASDDLFDDGGLNDLFGDRTSSPEQERHQPAAQVQQQEQQSQAPPQRPGGLALPSKTGLALPGYSGIPQARQPPTARPRHSSGAESLSPPSFREEEYSPSAMSEDVSPDEDEGEEDEVVLAQRRLFKMAKQRQAGQETGEQDEDLDMDTFYSFFPGYEKDANPRFVEFFPPRPVQYRGKLPPKPPKPIQPSKLSLDLLPDQERTFKSVAPTKGGKDLGYGSNIVSFPEQVTADDESDDGLALNFNDDESVAGMRLEDFALICEDWDVASLGMPSVNGEQDDAPMDGDYETEDMLRPGKKRKTTTNILDNDMAVHDLELQRVFRDPERASARLAKAPLLDLNDPHLLIDEHAAPAAAHGKHANGDATKDFAKRYNISNDPAYDLLKENHQHKIRSTLSTTTVEHALPAHKLQYPFYRVSLDPKAKRTFHRPALELRLRLPREEFRMQRLRTIKKKERRGKDVKELFATADSLGLGDNGSMLMLEYSEEAPMMLSNFGMGSRLVNFYRKRHADDNERPKRDIGETQVLMTQDKSPFGGFGDVEQGEVVPTVQNQLYRAPVFTHEGKPEDFFLGISTTHGYGSKMYLRNMENLHTVGQQFPISEIPGEHSRRVTDAAKKRLRALAYRIYFKSLDETRRPKRWLDNASIMEHLKGHDMPQTRSKMREFMNYQAKVPGRETGIWVPPKDGSMPQDLDTVRNWVKPEEICLLDSMQVGVQRLQDLGLAKEGGTGKEGGGADDEKAELGEDANIELQLAPWRATKNFLSATQGKAMLKLHGEGDPTGRGEGFSFVKTSMKGGFQALGESVEDKIDAKKRRENGGHSYNVAKQQKAYEEYIRMIWSKQKSALSSNLEASDVEMDVDDEPADGFPGRAGTPRSSFAAGTPSGYGRRGDDETGTQFSRTSNSRYHDQDKVLIIRRTGGRDAYGNPEDTVERVTNPRVIKEYKRRRNERRLEDIDIHSYQPDGRDPELDVLVQQKIQQEIARVQRNADRREARERQKQRSGAGGIGSTSFSANSAGGAGSPSASAAGSPGPSDVDGPGAASQDQPPQKSGGTGKSGRNKDGTARKCANCGQVGHIKTNRKSVYLFFCPSCGAQSKVYPGGVVKDGLDDGDIGAGTSRSPQTKRRKGRGEKPKKNGQGSSGGNGGFLEDDYSRFDL
ncbi:hypothetical protein D0865_08842 [Hortaea werneckii]|uniref:Transcription initiation factor TFIID subunit 1 histone acetyltransferase domain-containing protein n=1 Tax=Hortaea werneckii TaxID=91943 RepID=A0A3M7C5B2_HORWE|nr:hypothetical protein D0865_08842 [Hortaea werneckii]